ncbi:MAG: hydroxyacylglutathione hydrolase [Myxococcales bacterium]|nr:hydroxyacylglutathione hydrolase [Myxococcales bacterium]
MSDAPFTVIPVPCFADNYAYLVSSVGSSAAFCVDASEAAPIEAQLILRGLELTAILSTHHHYDHVGGNLELAESRPGLPIYAHESDAVIGRVPGQTHALVDGEAFVVNGISVRAVHVPGHTLGAVAFVAADCVFTGDTLFLAGCGRLFEGTPAMMHAALGKLASLPPATRVYCGHEYTLKNLAFAARVEPENAAILERQQHVATLRARALPTVPGTLGDEFATNPFLRVSVPALLTRYRTDDAVRCFASLRAERNEF